MEKHRKHVRFRGIQTSRDWIWIPSGKGFGRAGGKCWVESLTPPAASPAGSPDSRYIRVETCMFMIKLPQYSSLDIMLEKLRYAIHYREDPLSG